MPITVNNRIITMLVHKESGQVIACEQAFIQVGLVNIVQIWETSFAF
jgi:hypothetical protein